jgi:hypothetical protein
MKRILSAPVILVLILVLVLGAGWFWLQRGPGPKTTDGAANQDARALTGAEQAVFLPLVCGGASAGSGGYAHNCTSLPGYPSDDYGGAGTGLGITLTSIAYGNFTAPDQAYVSYQGSFEPHVNNFGGGILFQRNVNGWALTAWHPGNSLDGCLALNPSGQTPFLCTGGSTGQGETDTVLGVTTVGGGLTKILTAADLRETMDANANCGQRKPGQDVLLSIDSVARDGAAFEVLVQYVPAATADAACQAKSFGTVAVTKTALPVSWNGSAAQVTTSPHNFAAGW